MSDPLETIRADLRRHGKAALAAQAAAERCAELVEKLVDASPGEAAPAGSEPILDELIPVVDGVARLRAQAERDAQGRWPWRRSSTAVVEGLRIVEAQLLDVLAGHDVKVERPREGERFDPTRHRAVGTRPGRPETVVEVVRPGYLRGDRRLREADVIVGVRA